MILCAVNPCNQIDCYYSRAIFTTPVF